MLKPFSIWKDILNNPLEGFPRLKESGIFWPFFYVVIFTTLITAMLIPLVQSSQYTEALVRAQVTLMEEKGSPLSSNQVEAMRNQLNSPVTKNIQVISTVLSPMVALILMMLLAALILKGTALLFKDKSPYGLLLKILIYSSVISVFHSLLKQSIVLMGEWQTNLANVTNMMDFQRALTTQLGLTLFLDTSSWSPVLFFVVDYFTDIFNWLYYGFLGIGIYTLTSLDRNKTVALLLLNISVFLVIQVGLQVAFS